MNTDVEKLKDFMKKEVVHFEYLKKDGTIREANGTTNGEIISKYFEAPVQPTNKRNYTYSEDAVRYFDIDSKGWRSFTKENFRSFTLDD